MTWPDLMAQTPRVEDPLVVRGDEQRDKYQMPFKMTVADRDLLRAKAEAAGVSPTRWLVEKIRGNDSSEISLKNGIAFVLDKRRRKLADVVARQLGFHEAEHLAKDLLYRALQDPERAEEFLFGNLQANALKEAKDESKPASQSVQAA